MTGLKMSAGMILAMRMPATANDEPPESVLTSGIRKPMTSQSPTPLTNCAYHSLRNGFFARILR